MLILEFLEDYDQIPIPPVAKTFYFVTTDGSTGRMFVGRSDGTLSEYGGGGGSGGGAPGADGADGKSAYEIAVDNGFLGTKTEWLASLKGEKGNDGESVTASDIIVNNLDGDETDKAPSVAAMKAALSNLPTGGGSSKWEGIEVAE